jgi:hypothetical protein
MEIVVISDKEMKIYKRKSTEHGYLKSLIAKRCGHCGHVFSLAGLEERRNESNIAQGCPDCEGLGILSDYDGN